MSLNKNTDFSTLPYIIAVDADGTLWNDEFPEIGSSINTEFIDSLKRDQKKGAKLILWTCRTNEDGGRAYLDEAVDKCKECGLVFDAVNDNIAEVKARGWDARKVYADVYLDDKAVHIHYQTKMCKICP
jgi:hydroxymethylpyrimidine pyrophosphatase-like HAD family hydrolase